MGLTGAVGREELERDGYRFVTAIEPVESDFDGQGHLNNASIARLFNDMRIAYVRGTIGDFWIEMLQSEQLVVAARELHISYDSEGFPGENLLGATRYTRWDGRAAIIEQRIVEAETGRSLARGWVVQLLVKGGRAIDWPERYYDRVCEIEGHEVERRPSRRNRAFGPPD